MLWLRWYCTPVFLNLWTKLYDCSLKKYINAGFNIPFINTFSFKISKLSSSKCHLVFQTALQGQCLRRVNGLGRLYVMIFTCHHQPLENLESCAHFQIFAETKPLNHHTVLWLNICVCVCVCVWEGGGGRKYDCQCTLQLSRKISHSL